MVFQVVLSRSVESHIMDFIEACAYETFFIVLLFHLFLFHKTQISFCLKTSNALLDYEYSSSGLNLWPT